MSPPLAPLPLPLLPPVWLLPLEVPVELTTDEKLLGKEKPPPPVLPEPESPPVELPPVDPEDEELPLELFPPEPVLPEPLPPESFPPFFLPLPESELSLELESELLPESEPVPASCARADAAPKLANTARIDRIRRKFFMRVCWSRVCRCRPLL